MERMGQPITRAVIVGAAPFRDPAYLCSLLREDDVLVAADGGWRLLQAMGKTPTMVIGDFDSFEQPTDSTVPCTVLPVRKDDTDVMAAVRMLLEQGYREFLLLGVLGGRLDHTLANVFVLRYLLERGATGRLVDEAHDVTLLGAGRYSLEPREGMLFSLLPYGGDVHGLTVMGAAYEAKGVTLDTSFPLGVSNAFSEKSVTISFKDGLLLCILAKE